MSRYIMPSAYFSAIVGTRVFNWLVNLQMTNDNFNFLRHAYYGVDSTSTFSINPGDDQMYQTAKKFKCLGLITEAIEEGGYQFVAPIVRVILGSRLFNSRTSLTQSTGDFDNFLLLSIERMRSLILLNSLSRNISESARLIERQLQTEWLLAATTAIPLGSSINPDVGSVYGARGYLDFYIDGLNWCVGIMREGKMMADLIDHFDREGKHSNIPFARWAIIDFRHKSTAPKKLESNVWYALYADDYKTITVRRQGHEDMVLILCGDGFLSPFQST